MYLLDLKQEQRLAQGATLDLAALETTLGYPNPFEREATIEYVASEAQDITIEVYDVLGRTGRGPMEGTKEVDVHRIQWRGKNQIEQPVGSGMYFVRTRAEDKTETKKLVRVR